MSSLSAKAAIAAAFLAIGMFGGSAFAQPIVGTFTITNDFNNSIDIIVRDWPVGYVWETVSGATCIEPLDTGGAGRVVGGTLRLGSPNYAGGGGARSLDLEGNPISEANGATGAAV